MLIATLLSEPARRENDRHTRQWFAGPRAETSAPTCCTSPFRSKLMGAYESRQQHSAEEAEPIADYYALLEVSEDATQDEIKKVG